MLYVKRFKNNLGIFDNRFIQILTINMLDTFNDFPGEGGIPLPEYV